MLLTSTHGAFITHKVRLNGCCCSVCATLFIGLSIVRVLHVSQSRRHTVQPYATAPVVNITVVSRWIFNETTGGLASRAEANSSVFAIRNQPSRQRIRPELCQGCGPEDVAQAVLLRYTAIFNCLNYETQQEKSGKTRHLWLAEAQERAAV